MNRFTRDPAIARFALPRLLALALATAVTLPAAAPQKQVRVLLDTDCYNEIDDQFFVAYSLLEPSFEIEGIAATQYRWERGSVDESYYEILKVLQLMGVRPRFPIVRGADSAMTDAAKGVRSKATDLIRQAALKDRARPLYILAVGALTNVASALVLHPEIKPLVRVIWLGGYPPDGGIREFNAHNDVPAVKAVFESGVDVTVVPTETSARMLTLTLSEAERNLRQAGPLGRFLYGNLRDYGDRNKVIWDISATAALLQLVRGDKFFEVRTEPAPRVDAAAARYIFNQGPHKVKVTGAVNRAAVFQDFFNRLPRTPDTDAPSLLFAAATGDGTSVDLAFSETLDAAKAARASCYSVASGTVREAKVVRPDTVRLSVAPPVEAKQVVRVAPGCVTDTAGNAVAAEWSEAAVKRERGTQPGLALAAYAVAPRQNTLPPQAGQPIYRGVLHAAAVPAGPDEPESVSPPLPETVTNPQGGILLVAEGYLYMPFDHRVDVEILSRRFGRVYLDGELFLDQSRGGDRKASRMRLVREGPHHIRIEHYADRAAPFLSLFWSLPFHDKSLIAGAYLCHRPQVRTSARTPAPGAVQHGVVYREAGRFAGWPANHGIWAWGDEILVGFEIGYHRDNPRGHAIDYSRPAEHVLARSLDGGVTWKIERPEGLRPPAGEKVAEVPTGSEGRPPTVCPGGIDFTAPGFAFTARMANIHVGPSRFYYTLDRGKTWFGPFILPDFGQKGVAARTDYIVNGKHDMTVFLTAAKSNGREGRVIVARTQDGAKTWRLVGFIGPEPPEDDFAIMPQTVRFSPTHWLTAVRHRRFIAAWRTEDGGRTWREEDRPAPDTGGGNPPSMILLRDGRVALTYGYRTAPLGIRARLSSDQGRTWGDEFALRTDGGSGDLGYPRSVQRRDGKVVTCYYFNNDPKGERFIGVTIWDPGKLGGK